MNIFPKAKHYKNNKQEFNNILLLLPFITNQLHLIVMHCSISFLFYVYCSSPMNKLIVVVIVSWRVVAFYKIIEDFLTFFFTHTKQYRRFVLMISNFAIFSPQLCLFLSSPSPRNFYRNRALSLCVEYYYKEGDASFTTTSVFFLRNKYWKFIWNARVWGFVWCGGLEALPEWVKLLIEF